jgi:hypothetical protein
LEGQQFGPVWFIPGENRSKYPFCHSVFIEGARVLMGEIENLWDVYLNIINEREKKLLEFLSRPRTLNEIVEAWIVYGRQREPNPFFEFGGRALMKKHLECLMRLGEVFREREKYIKLHPSPKGR